MVRPAATAADWRDAARLLDEYAGWIRAAAGFDLTAAQPSFGDELRDLRGAYADRSDATLLLARVGGRAVGTVAVRVAPDRSSELKRLYVRPAARGRGAADALVAAALEGAVRLGASSMWLETKPGLMDPAIAVYERHGFRRSAVAASLPVPGVLGMHRDLRTARWAS